MISVYYSPLQNQFSHCQFTPRQYSNQIQMKYTCSLKNKENPLMKYKTNINQKNNTNTKPSIKSSFRSIYYQQQQQIEKIPRKPRILNSKFKLKTNRDSSQKSYKSANSNNNILTSLNKYRKQLQQVSQRQSSYKNFKQSTIGSSYQISMNQKIKYTKIQLQEDDLSDKSNQIIFYKGNFKKQQHHKSSQSQLLFNNKVQIQSQKTQIIHNSSSQSKNNQINLNMPQKQKIKFNREASIPSIPINPILHQTLKFYSLQVEKFDFLRKNTSQSIQIQFKKSKVNNLSQLNIKEKIYEQQQHQKLQRIFSSNNVHQMPYADEIAVNLMKKLNLNYNYYQGQQSLNDYFAIN